jgi:hypothetical protein
MTDTSVSAQAPPRQDDLVTTWNPKGQLRLLDLGGGEASVTMLIQGLRREVGRVSYGASEATSTPRWNKSGLLALEQFKRDALDTQIYKVIAQWLRDPS